MKPILKQFESTSPKESRKSSSSVSAGGYSRQNSTQSQGSGGSVKFHENTAAVSRESSFSRQNSIESNTGVGSLVFRVNSTGNLGTNGGNNSNQPKLVFPFGIAFDNALMGGRFPLSPIVTSAATTVITPITKDEDFKGGEPISAVEETFDPYTIM
ncbi:unnamed protein product, partial [Cyprideis torosa]